MKKGVFLSFAFTYNEVLRCGALDAYIINYIVHGDCFTLYSIIDVRLYLDCAACNVILCTSYNHVHK